MSTHPDKAVIDALGGPAELARVLGFDTTRNGVQRVYNWTFRGIPDSIRLRHMDVFGSPLRAGEQVAGNDPVLHGTESSRKADALKTPHKKGVKGEVAHG